MSDFFSDTVAELAAMGVTSPRLEAREIFAFVQHKKAEEIYSGCQVSIAEEKQIKTLLAKRKSHCPLDKILGKKGFYKSEFITNQYVLSPRPETEIIVEKALELLPKESMAKILDLGTGSGCIVESVLLERPFIQAVAVDISLDALTVAQQNAQNLHVNERLQFINADWFDIDFLKYVPRPFQLIVSNPPYIPQAEIATLDSEVKDFDPLLALVGGKSGFDSYLKIAELVPDLLEEKGFILLEAGKDQAQQIADIYIKGGLKLVQIVKDLSEIDRCVILQK